MKQELFEKAVAGYADEDCEGCVLIGEHPNYYFLFFPDLYRRDYRVQKGTRLQDLLITNDFGTALDFINERI